jgi:hypothetical protein
MFKPSTKDNDERLFVPDSDAPSLDGVVLIAVDGG